MARKKIDPSARRRPIGADISKPDEAVSQQLVPDNINAVGSRLEKALNQTPGEKRKAKKDKGRNTAFLDLPPELTSLIDELSKQEEVSKSQMYCFLTIQGLKSILQEGIRFGDHKTMQRSYLFPYTFEMPELPSIDLFIPKLKNGDSENTD
jgi:hypothetical protein